MKTVVLGTGRMGRRHIQVVREMGMDLAGVCDVKVEALALAGKEQQIPEDLQFTDIKALFKKARPECVIVATTAPTHCEYTCLAAENGAKFILCEKPMAVSLEECDRMIACCRKNGALLAINHQMRFMEQYIEAKKLVQSDAFGGLSSVTVLGGNFGLAMNGTHYFEMFRYLTDEAPAEVTAWFSSGVVSNPRGPQFEDRAGSLRLTTKSGTRLYIEASADQGHGMQVAYIGKFGQLIVDELSGLMRWAVREEQYRTLPTTRYGMPWIEENRKIAPADSIAPSKAVLKALLENKNYPTGEDGRLAIATLVAAYMSHENGHTAVLVEDQLPSQKKFPWA